MAIAELELAGFVDAGGNLGRWVPTGQILVPGKIWLKDDAIRWDSKTARYQEISPSMLNEFIRLTDAESILRFAKRWGVLALSGGVCPRPGRDRLREGSEPVAAWQAYSRRAQALLQIAAALKQDKLGDLKDWNMFASRIPSSGNGKRSMEWLEAKGRDPMYGMPISVFALGDSPEKTVESARGFIAGEIGHWLDAWKLEKTGDVSDLALRWNKKQGRWDLQIDYHGLLFAAIALQLALVIAGADSLFACSGCGVPYIRQRERKRPKAGWANYCEQCAKDGVAKRRAVESYRGKKAEAARLHAGGMRIPEIAEQLKSDATRVRGWLKKGAGAPQ